MAPIPPNASQVQVRDTAMPKMDPLAESNWLPFPKDAAVGGNLGGGFGGEVWFKSEAPRPAPPSASAAPAQSPAPVPASPAAAYPPVGSEPKPHQGEPQSHGPAPPSHVAAYPPAGGEPKPHQGEPQSHGPPSHAGAFSPAGGKPNTGPQDPQTPERCFKTADEVTICVVDKTHYHNETKISEQNGKSYSQAHRE